MASLELKLISIRKLAQLLGKQEVTLNFGEAATLVEAVDNLHNALAREYRTRLDEEPVVAILNRSVFYGVPRFGHPDCCEHFLTVGTRFVTRAEPDIERKLCFKCDLPILPTV